MVWDFSWELVFKCIIMKKLVTWYKKFIRRHIACWLEEYFKPYSQPSDSPVADVNVLCASVHRYFKYNQSDLLYLLPYEPMYEAAIDGIRQDGWQVTLHVNTGGELFC